MTAPPQEIREVISGTPLPQPVPAAGDVARARGT